MKLTLIRDLFLPDRTLGKLYINGDFFCDTLEDTDRKLSATDSLNIIESTKIKHLTAIPTGSYKVIISFSPRFAAYLPLLLNVPAFLGIRIHAGNEPEHTSGCILVGRRVGNSLKYSRKECERLLRILKKAEKLSPIVMDIRY